MLWLMLHGSSILASSAALCEGGLATQMIREAREGWAENGHLRSEVRVVFLRSGNGGGAEQGLY